MGYNDYEEFDFDRIVKFTQDDTYFIAARGNASSRLRLFLIRPTGEVYVREGITESWEQIEGSARRGVIARLTSARNRNIPQYTVNGSAS